MTYTPTDLQRHDPYPSEERVHELEQEREQLARNVFVALHLDRIPDLALMLWNDNYVVVSTLRGEDDPHPLAILITRGEHS